MQAEHTRIEPYSKKSALSCRFGEQETPLGVQPCYASAAASDHGVECQTPVKCNTKARRYEMKWHILGHH